MMKVLDEINWVIKVRQLLFSNGFGYIMDRTMCAYFPFPFGVWGRMWNSIVSVPDHCLITYFTNYIMNVRHI